METADPESASPSSATAEEASAPSEEAGKIWAPEPRPPLVPETDGTLPTLKSSRKHYKRKQWPPFVEMYVLIDIETSGGVKGENRIISLASRAYVGSPRPRPGDWFDSGLVELRSVIGGGDAGGTDSAKDSATDSATDSGTDSDKDSATASEWRQRIESLGLDLTDSAADFDELVQIPSYQSINFFKSVVKRERCTDGTWYLEKIHDRLCAMMSGSNRNTHFVKDTSHVIGVNGPYKERDHRGLLGSFTKNAQSFNPFHLFCGILK